MTPLDKLDRFEELVMTLGNRESRGVRLIACTPDFAQFVVADGSVIVVLRHTLGDADRLDRMVLRVCEGLKQGTMFLVAAGGGHEARKILQEHAPRARFGKKIFVFTLDDDREVWTPPGNKSDRDLVAALKVTEQPVNRTPAEFHSWLQEQKVEARRLRTEVESYQRTMVARRPVVTTALIAVTVAVFGLEWFFGGSDSVPTLVRMGALVGDGSHPGEAWRLLSHSFLHAGLMHLGGNLLILWMLGSFLERLIGPWRLLSLWTLSIVGGAIASLLGPGTAAVMVGASGGGWGLMAAAGTLALQPRGLIPVDLARSLRQSIGQVLVINLFISFLPDVALAAHLGGGATGALAVLTGLATLGLVPAHQRQSGLRPSSAAGTSRFLGLIAGILLVSSLGLGLARGQAWLLSMPPSWERHVLGNSGISIELPSSLPPPQRWSSSEGLRLDFGQPLADPLRVQISVTPIKGPLGAPSKSPIRLFREYRKLKQRHLGEPPLEGMVRLGEPIQQEIGESFHLDEAFSLPGGGQLWRHGRVVPSATLVVSVIADERDGKKRTPWAARIIGSVRTGPQGLNQLP